MINRHLLKIYAYFAPYYKLLMKAILSEKNLVVILFILVLVTFSMAQEDTRKMEKIYSGTGLAGESRFLTTLADQAQDHSASVHTVQ